MSNLSYQGVFEVGRLYQAYVNEVSTIRRNEALKLIPDHPNEDPKLKLIRQYKRKARPKFNYTRKIRKPYQRLFEYYEF